MKFEEYVFDGNDRRRYFISDRRGTYVKSIKLIDGASLYEFTRHPTEAAQFDCLSAITQPIVDAQHLPSFYFDPLVWEQPMRHPKDDHTMSEAEVAENYRLAQAMELILAHQAGSEFAINERGKVIPRPEILAAWRDLGDWDEVQKRLCAA